MKCKECKAYCSGGLSCKNLARQEKYLLPDNDCAIRGLTDGEHIEGIGIVSLVDIEAI